jgi:outer membrane protein
VNRSILILPSLVLGMSVLALGENPPTKVGIIHIQNAIISTKDGQKAAADLQAKFEPTRKRLESKRSEIATLQAELSKGSNTMSEERRIQITREIDEKTKSLNRDTEDAQADFEMEQNKILQSLGQKIMAVIDKYSRDNGYSLILDVSSPQTPVLYAANGIDITQEIVDLYDKNSAPATSSTAPAPAKPPAAAAAQAKPAPAKPTPAPAKK